MTAPDKNAHCAGKAAAQAANKSNAEAASKSAAEAASKIVNFDEYRKRIDDLRWTQMSFGEKLFDAFVNTPYNMVLFVRRGISEGIQTIFKGNDPAETGASYVDRLNGDVYLDRAAAECDNRYALGHGLSKKFQEKAVRIARQAFDDCRDFSVLKRTGQLAPLYPA